MYNAQSSPFSDIQFHAARFLTMCCRVSKLGHLLNSQSNTVNFIYQSFHSIFLLHFYSVFLDFLRADFKISRWERAKLTGFFYSYCTTYHYMFHYHHVKFCSSENANIKSFMANSRKLELQCLHSSRPCDLTWEMKHPISVGKSMVNWMPTHLAIT